MSRSVNRVTLIGNVGSEPDIRMTPSGTKVAKVSLATSRQWKDKSGTANEKTDWHRLTFFGQIADVVEQWVRKGDRIYVEGRIEYSTSEHDGVTKYFTDIIVQELVMLGGHANSVPGSNDSAPDSEIPF